MVASRGPAPKREDMRVRTAKPEDGLTVSKPPANGGREPAAATYWCSVAADMYRSMCDSGQSVFFEASDYQTLWLLCDQLHALYQPMYLGMQSVGIGVQKPFYARRPMLSGELGVIMKGLGALGATEGDRRRIRIELQRGDAGVTELPPGVAAFGRARRGRKPKEESA